MCKEKKASSLEQVRHRLETTHATTGSVCVELVTGISIYKRCGIHHSLRDA